MTNRASFRVKSHAAQFLAAITLSAFIFSACTTIPEATVRGGSAGPTFAEIINTPYNGAKARLAVAKFVDKTGKGEGEIGAGMSNMMVSALFRTNRFILLEREELDDVLSEQDFGASGRVSEETAAQIGQVEGAELIVIGSITEFEPDTLGMGGLMLGVLTGIGSVAIASANRDMPIGYLSYTESSVAADIRIIDAKTSRIVSAVTVRGKTQDWGGGIMGGVGGGWSRMPVYLGGWQSESVDLAIRVCIEKAVAEIVANTPDEYYRVAEGIANMDELLRFDYIDLPNAKAKSRKERSAYLIRDGKDWAAFASSVSLADAPPPADLATNPVIAAFGGDQPTGGYSVIVEKIIAKPTKIEVQLRMIEPTSDLLDAIEGETKNGKALDEKTRAALAKPSRPFSTVKSPIPAGRPVKFVWLG